MSLLKDALSSLERNGQTIRILELLRKEQWHGGQSVICLNPSYVSD